MNKNINFSKEKKDQLFNEIIRFFEEERDEKIGILQAKIMLDFFKEI